MVVDFYPVKTISGATSGEWFIKILTFMGETQSKKFLNRIEMNLEIEDYIKQNNYEVVDFNTIAQMYPIAAA